MKKNGLKVAVWYVALIALVIVVIALLYGGGDKADLTYGDIVDYFEDEQVEQFSIDYNNATLKMIIRAQDDDDKQSVVKYRLADVNVFLLDMKDLIDEQYEAGIITKYDLQPATIVPWWVSFLPYLIIAIVFIVLWWYMMSQATGGKGSKIGNFGKAKMRTGDKVKVYFRDVAGADEEKAELEEIVEFLKDPQKFTKLGAKIPHGVLLMGPPGTGKTLLAKAVAGEAGVPFYSISGSDFVEMYVGVGASRVRDLFETARKNPASIVFIDEIDAVGRQRGTGLGGGHDEREQTLNQLLVEMDGFGSTEGIIVIAATNRPDVLDPALLRPGRFDRQITVHQPDIHGREEILHVHARNKPLEAGVDLSVIAKSTSGFTGADLANLLNEAALLAARKNKSLIGMDELEDAFTKIVAGPQKRSMRIKESEKLKTAYHEAGHAVLSHVLPLIDPVHQVSIIPSGNALGYTLNLPAEDKYSVYRNELKQKISMLLGGRVAEQLIFDDFSGGASNDIQRATQIARKMVMQLGMSELGPILFGSGHSDTEVFLGRDFSQNRDFSEAIAAKIDEQIEKIITESYNEAKRLLSENIDKLHFIAKYLVKNEIMNGEQFRRIMEDPNVTVEELEEMYAEKRRRSEAENEARALQIKENERRREEARRLEEKQRGEVSNNPDKSENDANGAQ
ncbi:MAG: ATP-dependent zinc metalloprotease FtsH [Clostridiales bacterium]|jgi:cell division protease FtsH|nr:ATP-dependent zinc metalloprotease FtsH [Clostridiales bacterium]